MILDTNALSAFLDSEEGAVAAVTETLDLAIPVIVAGEFSFGIAQSRYRESYERALQQLVSECRVLAIDIETARHYASIRLELKRVGRPIPANDVWIAALSRQHAMPILSRDSHFDFVGGLRRRTW